MAKIDWANLDFDNLDPRIYKSPRLLQKAMLIKQFQEMQRMENKYAELEPFLLEAIGFRKDEEGNFVKMTDEERYERMSDLEKLQYDNAKLLAEREKMALEGKLPISPAMEENLAQQRSDMEGILSQKLGTDWQTTTAGIQAMGEFDRNAELMREEARRGMISEGVGLNLAQSGFLSGLTGQKQGQYGNYLSGGSGIFNMAGATASGVNTMRQTDIALLQALESRDKGGSNWGSALMGMGGQMAGTVGGAYAAAKLLPLLGVASSREFKKDIKKLSPGSEEEALDLINSTDTYTFKYKGDNNPMIGMIAEEAPEISTSGFNKKAINIGNHMGLLTAAMKALSRKIDKIAEVR